MQAVGQGYLHLWWYFSDFKRPKHFPNPCKYLCIINGHQNCIVLHTKPIKRGNGYSQLDITIYSKELWKISAWNISYHNLMLRTETVHRYWPLCLWLHKRWMKKSVKFSYSWNSSLSRWSLSPPRKWAWSSQINDNCVTSCVCVGGAWSLCILLVHLSWQVTLV